MTPSWDTRRQLLRVHVHDCRVFSTKTRAPFQLLCEFCDLDETMPHGTFAMDDELDIAADGSTAIQTSPAAAHSLYSGGAVEGGHSVSGRQLVHQEVCRKLQEKFDPVNDSLERLLQRVSLTQWVSRIYVPEEEEAFEDLDFLSDNEHSEFCGSDEEGGGEMVDDMVFDEHYSGPAGAGAPGAEGAGRRRGSQEEEAAAAAAAANNLPFASPMSAAGGAVSGVLSDPEDLEDAEDGGGAVSSGDPGTTEQKSSVEPGIAGRGEVLGGGSGERSPRGSDEAWKAGPGEKAKGGGAAVLVDFDDDPLELVPQLDRKAWRQRQAAKARKLIWGEPWGNKIRKIRRKSVYSKLPSWCLRSIIVKSGDDVRQEVLAAQLISQFKWIFDQAPGINL